MAIPIIDIFAGPGGLSEGFSRLRNGKDKPVFKVKLSIEKDQNAHQTLQLRSFFRQFKDNEAPPEYYSLLQDKYSGDWATAKAKLFELFPKQGRRAEKETWCTTLGEVCNSEVDKRIAKAIDRKRNWVLIGGPPCQAYSIAGRGRVGGIDSRDHRVYLYEQYLRIIAVHQPSVFVMENVKGLLSAKIQGENIFDKIKQDLQQPGSSFDLPSSEYRILSFVKSPCAITLDGKPEYCENTDFLIRSEDYGIPQTRHRVILLGIRNDIDLVNMSTLQRREWKNIEDAIGDLPVLRSGISSRKQEEGSYDSYTSAQLVDNSSNWLALIKSFYNQPESGKLMSAIAWRTIESKLPNTKGSNFVKRISSPDDQFLQDWYMDVNLEGVYNHESRSHMVSDLSRYFYLSLYAFVHGYSLKLSHEEFLPHLVPKHKNARSGKFNDRFRVQIKGYPATTITSHISKDGHYFIHYDFYQCRSLTVREAARIQTFPDNYFFCGSRTSQYVQVGNAVPPLLAYQLSKIVYRLVR